jgi:hypothetical protein
MWGWRDWNTAIRRSAGGRKWKSWTGVHCRRGARAVWCPCVMTADTRTSHLRRGWYWGRQEFAEKLRRLMGAKLRSAKSRAVPADTAKSVTPAGGGAAVLEGIKAAGLVTKDLEGLPGSDPRKVALGKLVREKTVASCGWLAAKLKMRSAANVSQTLRRTEWKSPMKRLPRTLAEYINEEKNERICTLAPSSRADQAEVTLRRIGN